MKIEGLISEEEYQDEKKKLLEEDNQIKENIVSDGVGEWTRVMEETLSFASKLTKLFEDAKEDPVARRMILKILGSNLELKDKKVRITAKKVFVFFKQVEDLQNGEIDRLEPKITPIDGGNKLFLPLHSHLERVTGIEPVSSPWKGDILAFVLYPLVGETGLEPATSRSQSARASHLRHSPF